MKTVIKVVIAVLLVVAIGAGGFIGYKSSQGISYDVSSAEKVGTDVEIVSENDDSVTIKKKSDGEFKVLMFTDTHFCGKRHNVC